MAFTNLALTFFSLFLRKFMRNTYFIQIHRRKTACSKAMLFHWPPPTDYGKLPLPLSILYTSVDRLLIHVCKIIFLQLLCTLTLLMGPFRILTGIQRKWIQNHNPYPPPLNTTCRNKLVDEIFFLIPEITRDKGNFLRKRKSN